MSCSSLLGDPQLHTVISQAISQATKDAINPIVDRQNQFEQNTISQLELLAIKQCVRTKEAVCEKDLLPTPNKLPGNNSSENVFNNSYSDTLKKSEI